MLLVIGPADVLRYTREVTSANIAAYGANPINVSIAAIMLRLFQPSVWFTPLIVAPELVAPVTLVFNIGFVVILALQTLRAPTAFNNDYQFAAYCIAMLLLAPISWVHAFPLLFLPFGLLWRDQLSTRRRIPLILTLLIVALLSIPDSRYAFTLMQTFAPNHMPWYVGILPATIGLLLLWWVLWRVGTTRELTSA